MKITSDYDSYTREILLAECSERGIDSVNSNSLKADIVAALELDDEKEKDPGNQPPEPLPSREESPLPVVERKPIVMDSIPGAPLDEAYVHGIFKKRTGDASGEPFALCKTEADGFGNTHHLKNTAHFWQGTEEQFRQEFDKA